MQREDIVFSIGNLILAAALLPSIFSTNKPSAITSLITCAILAAFCCCFIKMKYELTVWITGAASILWFVLFVQAL